jgi:protein-S-isoprenylcysteine O-methyltransferase Ste14
MESMASQRRNAIISTLFVIFGGPGFILGYFPFWITRFHLPANEPIWQMAPAAALILAGLVPLFESIVRFVRVGRGTLVPTTPTEELVVSGLYRYVRNPMYVGVLTAVAGEVVLFASRSMVLYAATVWLGFHLFVCFYEEPTIARRYGEQYAVYKRNVPRWLPRVTSWQGD